MIYLAKRVNYRLIKIYYTIVFSIDVTLDCNKEPSWSGSCGGWTYNFLCNHCLSPHKLWVRAPFMKRCTRYNIMW